MTDETDETAPLNPDDEPPQPPDPGAPRRLTRSSTDKLLGGVAGGLGRYFGVDPILFRIAFVVLLFAGGVGALAYIGLLAFVPSDDGTGVFGKRRDANLIGTILLGLLVVLIFGPGTFFIAPVLLPLAFLVLVGVLLWRAAGGARGDGDPGRTVARIAIALLIGIAALGGFTAVFFAAALGGGTVLAALAVVAGITLIATAFIGGARWLIPPALILVLPLAIVAAGDISFKGGVGERHYRPATMADVRSGYRLGMGELEVDLRDVQLPPGRTTLKLDLGVGGALVRVPENACVSSNVKIGAGAVSVLNHRASDGVDVAYASDSSPSEGTPQVYVDADIGVGGLDVRRGDDGPPWNWHDDAAALPACP
jgi:phage shock protein PspC (stress-responsive transcriptional regulator)/predicted membrane protein